MIQKNYGILASIDWNSNKWQALPKQEDIDNSTFEVIKENGATFTALNFGYDIFPNDKNGYYQGLIPHFWSKMPDKDHTRHVEIVFIKSYDWETQQSYLVGFYAFPTFQSSKKSSPLLEVEQDFEVNLKALPKDILLLENYINLTNAPEMKKFLPTSKTLGKVGYNYLTKENVFKILDAMTALNPSDVKLKKIKFKLMTPHQTIMQ